MSEEIIGVGQRVSTRRRFSSNAKPAQPSRRILMSVIAINPRPTIMR